MPDPKKAPELTSRVQPPVNNTVGDAIEYTKNDPGGLFAAVRWFVGFFVALFKKG